MLTKRRLMNIVKKCLVKNKSMKSIIKWHKEVFKKAGTFFSGYLCLLYVLFLLYAFLCGTVLIVVAIFN